jgi:decaprenylphospho-beta-D-ribofuranose 2-oxidase
MMQAYLSLHPKSTLTEMTLITFKEKKDLDNKLPPLKKNKKEKIKNKLFGWILNKSIKNDRWKTVAAYMQKYILPWSTPKEVTRNTLLNNSEMPKIAHIKKNQSVVLQAYLVPKYNFVEFIDKLKVLIEKHDVPLVNVAVLHVKSDQVSYLSSVGNKDKFLINLTAVQVLSENELVLMKKFKQEVTNQVLSLGGSFYLAHRDTYSQNQLKQAYPQIENFFSFKKQYDPGNIFSNKFYKKYSEALDK